MSPEFRRPLPLVRKLSLGNKIVLALALLMPALGGVALYAQHRVTRQAAEALLLERAEGVAIALSEPLRLAAEAEDHEALSALLERAARADDRLAYLAFHDLRGRALAHTGRAAASRIREADAGSPTPEAGDIFVEAAFPITARGEPVGTLVAGIERTHVDRVTNRVVLSVLALTLLPMLALLLVARSLVLRTLAPLQQLSRVADEIGAGNLDPRIDFGKHVNCWEIKRCQRTDCTAYLNLSKQCWYIDGTPCEGYESHFPQKLEGCRRCEVYQAHRGDEIVQLADAFRHMTDVLKESREELVKSDEFQKRLIRNSFDGIVATDAKGVITIFNRVAETLTGRSPDDLIGREHWSTLFEEQLGKSMDLPLSHERIRRVRGFRPRESVIRHADGTLVDVRLAGISLYERGIHVGKVFFFEDMREIKQLRDELIRSERLAATGQAAASISHSIRNILDGLRGGVYVFKQGQELGRSSKMETGWEMIERNVETISSLVKDLLNFAKPRKPDYRQLDPGSLMKRVLAQLGLSENGRIGLRTELGPPGVKVVVDPDAFEQCLANLVRNAVEAIPEDRTGQVTLAFRMEGGRALFTVSDDGVGMSSDTIEKVRGGMYSTKGSKGTGLGLLVIQKVVAEHNGSLDIESVQGRGSTFTISIPATGEQPAA